MTRLFRLALFSLPIATIIVVLSVSGAALAQETGTGNSPPVVSPILATLVIPTTTYVVQASDPDGDSLSYIWTGPSCGEFHQYPDEPWKFLWSHPHPPCDPTTEHEHITVQVRVSDGTWAVTCLYQGALSGPGFPCHPPERVEEAENLPPVVQPILASVKIPVAIISGSSGPESDDAPTTAYSVSAVDPNGDALTYTWGGPSCGDYNAIEGEPWRFSWSHPFPPCDEIDEQPFTTVSVEVFDGLWIVKCTYQGALSGTGRPCQTARTVGTAEEAALLGDINDDGKINIFDLAILGSVWGVSAGAAEFNTAADLDNSGQIGLLDLAILARNYGVEA